MGRIPMDNDLISRSALMDSLGASDRDIYCKEIIEDAPGVDAVPVVRCQDCIHLYSLMDCPLAYVDKQMGIVSARDVDFFCKDGERKEPDNG
jgi:hypothetical protein